MNRFTIFLGFLLILWFSPGCAPLYQPNSVNVPMFDSAQDARINVNLGTGGNDVQASYAVDQNFGVMLNYSAINRTSDSSKGFLKRNFLEGGIGIFGSWNEFGRISAFAGYGYGRLTALGEYPSLNGSNDLYGADSYYHRIFIQPSIGVSAKYLKLAFTSRFSVVNLVDRNQTWNRTFWEPTITLKAGGEIFRFIAQAGYVAPFDGSVLVGYNPFIMNVGLEFDIPIRRILQH